MDGAVRIKSFSTYSCNLLLVLISFGLIIQIIISSTTTSATATKTLHEPESEDDTSSTVPDKTTTFASKGITFELNK